jgi:hypothetical protein
MPACLPAGCVAECHMHVTHEPWLLMKGATSTRSSGLHVQAGGAIDRDLAGLRAPKLLLRPPNLTPQATVPALQQAGLFPTAQLGGYHVLSAYSYALLDLVVPDWSTVGQARVLVGRQDTGDSRPLLALHRLLPTLTARLGCWSALANNRLLFQAAAHAAAAVSQALGRLTSRLRGGH